MATMAASQVHSTLNVAPPGDDMEISSDAGQLDHYDDIDIDLMDPQEDDQDIDYMLEDEQEPHQDVQTSSRDDVMVDDVDDTLVAEDVMHDDEPDVQLTDIPDLYDQLQYQDNNDPDTRGPPQSDIAEDVTQVDDEILSVPEIVSPSYPDAIPTVTEETAANPALLHNPSSQPTSLTAPAQASEQAGVENDTQDDDAKQNLDEAVSAVTKSANAPNVTGDDQAVAEDSTDVASAHQHSEQQTTESEAASLQDPISLHDSQAHETEEISQPLPTEQPLGHEASNALETEDGITANEHSDRENEPAVPETSHELPMDGAIAQEGEQSLEGESTWTYLHPVTIEYDGIQMSLFPPMEEDPSATYLLQDISVADKSIADLFADCRQVLGQSIKEEDELEILCEELDLCISEDSKHCTDTSLSQIVHVYVTLMHLDGVETPEPLLIYLTTKTRFSAQLAALFQAESEGKGLSELQLRGSPSHDSSLPNGELYQDADIEAGHKAEAQEPLPKGQDSTETKTAHLSELQVINADQGPENIESIQDVAGQEAESFEEGQFELEEFPEGHTEENADNTDDEVQPAEQLHDNTQNQSEEPANMPYESTEQPEAEVEVIQEETSTDQAGDPEEGDVGSSGSSTVQGENDAFPIEAPIDIVPTLPTISETGEQEDTAPQSDDNALARKYDSTAPIASSDADNDEADHQTTEGQPHDEYTHAYNLDAVDQEWNPDEYEEEYNAEDASYDDLDYNEGDTSVVEESWGVLDQQTIPAYGNFYAVPSSPTKLPTTPGGLDQIPEEDEDEDSITYDDELEEEQPEAPASEADASQARPTNSPLGKRSREEDIPGGGDDGSDQDPELKRLKSH